MAFNNGYEYRRSITIDHDKVIGSSNFSDFAFLVKSTNVDFKDSANSGKVENSSGWDIRFETSGGSKLDHVLEKYIPSTGEVIAWVEIDSLLYNSDPVIYMYYGKSGLEATEEAPSGVWDSSFKLVQLMRIASGHPLDETLNGNDVTSEDITAYQQAGKNGYALDFESTNTDWLDIDNSASLSPTNITIEALVKIESYPGTYPRLVSKDGTGGGSAQQYQLVLHNTNRLFFRIKDGSTWYGGDFDVGGLSTGIWLYLVGTYDGTTLKAYINGVAETITFAHTGTINSGTDSLAIGSKADDLENSSYLIDGLVEFIKIHSTARTADWIATKNNAINPSTFYTLGSEEEEEGIISPFPSFRRP